jgi:glucose-1-phosphate cytidylyltransferase
MKVVLFCGGRGVRLRREGSDLPKPLVRIGLQPILWHVMKYYAHFGHKDFILCLGYKADYIKKFFLRYNEAMSNDFTLSDGGHQLDVFRQDINDWRITFVDTGLNANVGQRLRAVREHLAGEKMFLANYADGLTNLHLPTMIDHFKKSGATASFVSIRPQQSFHVVRMNGDSRVVGIDPMAASDIWINGGFFVFKQAIFDHLNEGEELVMQPFARLIRLDQLVAYKYDGFWASMDTFKDKQMLEAMHSEGRALWQVWSGDNNGKPRLADAPPATP